MFSGAANHDPYFVFLLSVEDRREIRRIKGALKRCASICLLVCDVLVTILNLSTEE